MSNAIPTVALWADPAQGPWLSAAVERAGMLVAGAGCPEPGRSPELAASMSGDRDAIPLFDDLRAVLTSAAVDLVVIAAPGDFAGGQRQGSMDREDAAALALCRARGVRVATLEPMPCSALQLNVLIESAASIGADVDSASEVVGAPTGAGIVLGPGAPMRTEGESARSRQPIDAGGGWARATPLLRLSRAVRDAADVIEQFGHVRTIVIEGWCGRGHGSLGSRLFDAMDCVVSFFGIPEQIDSTYVWPIRGRSLHHDAGETLRGLSGDLTANLRFADGRTASIAISDQAARWSRSIMLIGDGGRLRISDDGPQGIGTGTGWFVWLSADGASVDASRPADTRSGSGQGERADEALVDSFADQLERLIDPRAPAPPPTDYAGVLAAAGAALLSARTGEAESSQTILRMVNGR